MSHLSFNVVKNFLLIVFVLFSISCTSTERHTPEPVEVSVNELRRNYLNYNGKLIRVSGLWYRDFETSMLMMDDINEDDPIYIERNNPSLLSSRSYKKYEKSSKERIYNQIEKFKREGSRSNWTIWANVELEGYFDVADRKLNPPPPPKGDEFIILPGFGHLFGDDFQIRVTRLIRYEFLD